MESPLRVLCAVALAVSFGFLLPAGPAAAECNSETALFEDDFEFLDPTWGNPADNFDVENGALVLKRNWSVVNFQTHGESLNACVDITVVEASDPSNSPVGLIWWWENWNNYYFLFYWPDSAWIEVRRAVNGEYKSLISLETLAIKQGVGETNHFELQIRPKDVTVLINGTQVTRFKGKQPKGGSPIGFYGLSLENDPAIWSFDNLVVSPAD